MIRNYVHEHRQLTPTANSAKNNTQIEIVVVLPNVFAIRLFDAEFYEKSLHVKLS